MAGMIALKPLNFILWNLLTYLPMIVALIVATTISYYKKKKIKEDALIIFKVLLIFLFLIYFCVYTMFVLITRDQEEKYKNALGIFNDINAKFFIPYLVSISLLNNFIARESFKTIKDPSFTLRSYITKKVWNFSYEIVILLILSITIFLEIYFQKPTDGSNIGLVIPEIDFYFYFYIVIFFMSAFSLTYYFYKREVIYSYVVKGKGKAFRKNLIELIQNLFYFFISFCLIIISGMELYIGSLNEDQKEMFTNLRLAFNYLFLIVTFIDLILMMYSIYISDFYYYTLGNVSIGRAYCIFGKKYHKKPKFDFSSMNNTNKENSVMFLHDNLSFMMDEYTIDSLDNVINITLASLHKIFSSIKQPAKVEKSNDVSLNLNMNLGADSSYSRNEIVISSPDTEKFKNLIEKEVGNDKILSSNDCYNDEGIRVYEFEKFEFTDDRLYKLISLQKVGDETECNQGANRPEGDLKVTVRSIYNENFSEVFKAKNKLNHQDLLDSLISNLNPNLNGWHSLINKNIKEEFFKKQNKLVLNTYNGLYNLEICEEGSIFSNEKSACIFAKKYLKYMINHQLSFLPIILGIFKIKINNYQEITVVLSKNVIVEETPKEYFNYWQLSRFNESQTFEMVTSSKDRTSNLIKDENFFTEKMVLEMNDYQNFCRILQDDILFLRQQNSQNFGMLVMYYELGTSLNISNSSPQEESPFQRISVENHAGKFRVSVISKNNYSMVPRDQIISAQNSLRNFSAKRNETQSLLEDINIILFKDKIGFEASYNNFRSILFFEFENAFESQASCFYKGYYRKFLSKFQRYFAEAKLFE